nr:PREDICTED: cation channel sperm-associated protein 1 [Latimeria chalumnae]XP_014339360.1 PREDICTED: cation channel sperm-associated protein 1 [Latimeria chalumnae]|eukprot:XP_014339358.1 PREDICTED: cation channel sperm-associated protein 1 [Latimeria chalumnae]
MNYLTVPEHGQTVTEEGRTKHKHKYKRLHPKKQGKCKICMKKLKTFLTKHYLKLHEIVHDLVESNMFAGFILMVVILNTVILVLETFDSISVRTVWFFNAFDAIFLAIYLMECILKIFVQPKVYFRNGWDDLDFFIVIMSLLDFILPLTSLGRHFNTANTIAVFKTLRVFKGIRAIRAIRGLRTIRFLENLQAITSTCITSMQSMGAIVLLMFSFLFMFSIVLRETFSYSDPERFGRIFSTIFTLFQLLTLDDWSFIYVTSRDEGYWYIIFFLVLYIVIEYFIFLNLFIAVLVDNFQQTIKKRVELKKLRQKKLSIDTLEEKKVKNKASEFFKGEEESASVLANLIEDHYPEAKFAQKERELLFHFFRLMAAVEYNMHELKILEHASNSIFDLMFDTSEEEKRISSASFGKIKHKSDKQVKTE